MKKELFVPFDGKGNLLDYVYSDITDDEKDVCRRNGVVIRDKGLSCMMFMPNYEFSDTMIFDGFSRGRSSVKAHFVSETTGRKYEMFVSDLGDAIRADGLHNARIDGKFTFTKRGQNYGVKLVEASDGDKT